jgi:exodeoxyribonuclease VII small subunit
MKNNEPQPRSFETSLEALEEIVHKLEQGDLPLEESLGLFEQGVQLSRECQERLSQAERRIEVLLRDQQGRPVVTAFEGDKATGEEDTNENAF